MLLHFAALWGRRIIPARKALSSPAFQSRQEPHVSSTSENISLKLWKMGLRQASPRRALLDLVKHFGMVTERRSHGKRFLGTIAPVFSWGHAQNPQVSTLHIQSHHPGDIWASHSHIPRQIPPRVTAQGPLSHTAHQGSFGTSVIYPASARQWLPGLFRTQYVYFWRDQIASIDLIERTDTTGAVGVEQRHLSSARSRLSKTAPRYRGWVSLGKN